MIVRCTYLRIIKRFCAKRYLRLMWLFKSRNIMINHFLRQCWNIILKVSGSELIGKVPVKIYLIFNKGLYDWFKSASSLVVYKGNILTSVAFWETFSDFNATNQLIYLILVILTARTIVQMIYQRKPKLNELIHFNFNFEPMHS